jgi:hypothetical protein
MPAIAATLLLMLLSALLTAAEPRPFRLGFTPWPSAATPEAVEAAWRTIAQEGDLVSQHLDNGVPWVEAAAGKRFDEAVYAEWDRRIERSPRNHARLLSLSPLTMGRDSLALWWGARENQPLPPAWESKNLDDPAVVAAYTRYVLAAVERFKPTWLAIGVEVNELATKKPALWPGYVALHRQVYQAVKAKYKTLPVTATLLAPALLEGWREQDVPAVQAKALADLLPFCDLMAWSLYPYMSRHFTGNYPVDWYDRLAKLVPDKPLAISECGFPAQPFTAFGIPFAGSPAAQEAFVGQLLSGAQRHRSPFVVWFTARDFDQLWATIDPSIRPLALLWRDTGLIGDDGQPRPALSTWRAARTRPWSAEAGPRTR